MNRLQKKCAFVSAGFHLLLLVILLVGPAFLSSRSKDKDDMPLLTIIPDITTDAEASGGGNPRAAPPPPAVREPQPTPPQPQPVRQVARTPEPSPEPAPIKRELPNVSTEVVRRPQANTSKAVSDRTDARIADNRRQAYQSALRDLRQGLSSSTEIEMPGFGGGGPTYANFLQAVKTIYANAWVVPEGVTDDEATATASVTIARDGTVRDARILRRSGNALADASVEAVLRRVTFAVPLPADAKENQRTVTIKFNVKAKRGLG